MSDTKLHEHTCRDLQTYQLNTRKKMNIKSNSRLEKPTTSKVHSDDETKGFFFPFSFFFSFQDISVIEDGWWKKK